LVPLPCMTRQQAPWLRLKRHKSATIRPVDTPFEAQL
jgi:hypothetical protein